MEITSGSSEFCNDHGGSRYSSLHHKLKKNHCEYCHFKGPTKENCYKLKGYPSGYKMKKRFDSGNCSINAIVNYSRDLSRHFQ